MLKGRASGNFITGRMRGMELLGGKKRREMNWNLRYKLVGSNLKLNISKKGNLLLVSRISII
jgi:hypothetical protein